MNACYTYQRTEKYTRATPVKSKKWMEEAYLSKDINEWRSHTCRRLLVSLKPIHFRHLVTLEEAEHFCQRWFFVTLFPLFPAFSFQVFERLSSSPKSETFFFFCKIQKSFYAYIYLFFFLPLRWRKKLSERGRLKTRERVSECEGERRVNLFA